MRGRNGELGTGEETLVFFPFRPKIVYFYVIDVSDFEYERIFCDYAIIPVLFIFLRIRVLCNTEFYSKNKTVLLQGY